MSDKMITVKIAERDVEGILELLSWAEATSKYLAELEAVKGTPKGGFKLKAYAILANNLIEFISSNVSIGEPDFNKVN